MTFSQVDEKGPLHLYIVQMIDEEGEWKVEFYPDTHEISCTCKMFESIGILCCHALKVYESKCVRIVPEQYIMKRWTREARSDVVFDVGGSEIQVDPKQEITRRHRHLLQKMVKLATKASHDKKKFEHVDKIITELDNEVSDDYEEVVDSIKGLMMDPQYIAKGLKKREGTKRKRRIIPWEEKNLMMRWRLTKEQEESIIYLIFICIN